MSKKHILIVDDDTRLRNLLGKFLEENNFQTSLAANSAEARLLIKDNNFDLIILDVMMPIENGVDFAASIRQNSLIPIIMLTARGDFEDRIKGLEAGADDYLAKPFEPKELLLRINNILKRIAPKNSENSAEKKAILDICKFGDFIFNISQFRLKKGEKFIHLTESEVKILAILAQNQGVAVSREELSNLLGDIDDRSIDVQITRLRKKIEENPKQPHYLQTVRNFGYILYN
jgi:two-component system phosphate regulon response regulator OmpR